jgi:GNAT superfamily N-acetyltransferase
MQISSAELTDIPALCALLDALFTQESEFTPDSVAQRRGLAAVIENPEIGEILVARKSGDIIGMINVLYTVSTALGGWVAVFEDMIIAAGARGAGTGSELLSHAIDRARQQGCKRISLLADSENEPAHRFYHRHGFSRSSMLTFRLLLDQSW